MKITTVRRQSVKVAAGELYVHCPVCGREVDVLKEPEAAQVLGIGAALLNALIASGQVHTIETASDNLGICKDSLFRKAVSRQANSIE